MSLWEEIFQRGIDAFRAQHYEDALISFTEAIGSGGEHYKLYDSRAAVHEKMGNSKCALKDSRKVIELAPHMRHGYTRSARLFLSLGKHDRASEMTNLALNRLKPNDMVHRLELENLQRNILEAKSLQMVRESHMAPHISKLPVELMSEIFSLAAEMDASSPACAVLVCSRWRTVALSVPRLWSCIVLSNIRPAQKLELWQERSRGQMISLRIRPYISQLQLKDSFDRCAPDFCKRLKSLHCEICLNILGMYLKKVPNFADLDLEDIRVSRPNTNRREPHISPITIPFGHTGNMKSLTIEYVPWGWNILLPFPANLHTVVIKSVEHLPMRILISLIHSNPYLEDVILESNTLSELVEGRADSRTQLDHLSQLQLLGPIDAAFIVSTLSLPNLKCLAISKCLRGAMDVISSLEPCFPALTELHIQKCYFSESRIITFLRQMQALVRLDISHSGGRVDIIVDALATHDQMDENNGVVCPRLQHVDFSHCPNLNGGPILRLVKSRLNCADQAVLPSKASIESIQSININGCPKVDPAVPEWLRSRVENVNCIYMTKGDLKGLNRRKGALYQ